MRIKLCDNGRGLRVSIIFLGKGGQVAHGMLTGILLGEGEVALGKEHGGFQPNTVGGAG